MINDYGYANPYGMQIGGYGMGMMGAGLPISQYDYGQGCASQASVGAYTCIEKDDTDVKVGVLGTLALVIATALATKGKGLKGLFKKTPKMLLDTEAIAKTKLALPTKGIVDNALKNPNFDNFIKAEETSTVVKKVKVPRKQRIPKVKVAPETIATATEKEAVAESERVADFYANLGHEKGKVPTTPRDWEVTHAKLMQEKEAEEIAKSEKVADFYANLGHEKGKVPTTPRDWEITHAKLMQEQQVANAEATKVTTKPIDVKYRSGIAYSTPDGTKQHPLKAAGIKKILKEQANANK